MWRLNNQSPVYPHRCVLNPHTHFWFRSTTMFTCLRLYHFTAAHCENDRESGRPVVAKMGVIYIHDNGPNAQIINIDSITSHRNYRSYQKYYDVALIKLQSFIRFDEHVRPACVATDPKQPTKMIATGFGKTQYGLIQCIFLERFFPSICFCFWYLWRGRCDGGWE